MTTDWSGSWGSVRSSRKTSASLPVLRMPSSVSIAPCEVTTQSGRGSGPRLSGSTSSQVDQRWSSPRSSYATKSKTNPGSSGSGAAVPASAGVEGNSRCMVVAPDREAVPQKGEVCGQAKDSRRHVTPPLDSDRRRSQVVGAIVTVSASGCATHFPGSSPTGLGCARAASTSDRPPSRRRPRRRPRIRIGGCSGGRPAGAGSLLPGGRQRRLRRAPLRHPRQVPDGRPPPRRGHDHPAGAPRRPAGVQPRPAAEGDRGQDRRRERRLREVGRPRARGHPGRDPGCR